MRKFEQNMLDIYGEQGKQWLASLPELTAMLASKYQLTQLQPVSNLSYNYVLAGYHNDKPIILKLGLDHKALAREVACLNAFQGQGAAQVLVSDTGMLIMERAVPAATLKTYFPDKEELSIEILCSIIKKLHCTATPKDHDFYTLKDLFEALDNDLDIPSQVLTKARTLRDNLLNTTDKTVLLHGDLHHENILKNDDDWMVIDPKGFVGDPIYDVCAFINNPIPELLEQESPAEIINNRIRQCAQSLGYSEQRLRDWHYVQSVLCWAWQLQDNLDHHYFSRILELN